MSRNSKPAPAAAFDQPHRLKVELRDAQVWVEYRLDGPRLKIGSAESQRASSEAEKGIIVTACWNNLVERGWRSAMNISRA